VDCFIGFVALAFVNRDMGVAPENFSPDESFGNQTGSDLPKANHFDAIINKDLESG